MAPNTNKPFGERIELSEVQKADIRVNQVRFSKFEETLWSILETTEDIDGSERVIELLKLGEIQLSLVKRESTVSSLKDEADKAWATVKKAIYIDKKGKASLIDHNLGQLVEDLNRSRSDMLSSLGELGGAQYMRPHEVAQSIATAPSLHDLNDKDVPPLDRTREKDVYVATTRGLST